MKIIPLSKLTSLVRKANRDLGAKENADIVVLADDDGLGIFSLGSNNDTLAVIDFGSEELVIKE